MEQIFDFISNNGFAIVMSVMLFLAYQKQGQQHADEVKAIQETHHEETQALLKQLTVNSEGIRANAEGIKCVLELLKKEVH